MEEFHNIFGPELKAVTGDPDRIDRVLDRVDHLILPIAEVHTYVVGTPPAQELCRTLYIHMYVHTLVYEYACVCVYNHVRSMDTVNLCLWASVFTCTCMYVHTVCTYLHMYLYHTYVMS